MLTPLIAFVAHWEMSSASEQPTLSRGCTPEVQFEQATAGFSRETMPGLGDSVVTDGVYAKSVTTCVELWGLEPQASSMPWKRSTT